MVFGFRKPYLIKEGFFLKTIRIALKKGSKQQMGKCFIKFLFIILLVSNSCNKDFKPNTINFSITEIIDIAEKKNKKLEIYRDELNVNGSNLVNPNKSNFEQSISKNTLNVDYEYTGFRAIKVYESKKFNLYKLLNRVVIDAILILSKEEDRIYLIKYYWEDGLIRLKQIHILGEQYFTEVLLAQTFETNQTYFIKYNFSRNKDSERPTYRVLNFDKNLFDLSLREISHMFNQLNKNNFKYKIVLDSSFDITQPTFLNKNPQWLF